MKYQDIRKFSYKTERKVLRSFQHNFDMDNWLKSPYTCLKVRFYIEFASFFVFLIQNTKIKPNQISYLYALAGLLGGAFISLDNNNFILAGIFIIFFKVAIDGSDGLLARVKYKASNFGAAIDSWGGLVGEYCFVIGLGFYSFNMTENINFIYVTFFIVLLKAIDLKNYILFYIGGVKYLNLRIIKEKIENKLINKKKNNSNGVFDLLKNFIKNGFNYHGKTVDMILLFMMLELYYGKILVSHYFLCLYFLRGIVIFFGNVFLAQKKNFFTKVVKNEIKYNK